MNTSELFSVLICVYGGDNPKTFSNSLESIFKNSVLPKKVVLVVDGPVTEGIDIVIENFKHNKSFKVFRLEKNLGLAHALNFGLRKIDTEWIIRADSDDYNVSKRFEILQHYMTKDFDLLGSYVAEKDENNEIYAIKKVPNTQNEIKKYIKKRNPFNHMSVAFRRSLVNQVGGYPNIQFREDYGLWASMLFAGCKCKNLDQVLVHASAGTKMFKRRSGGKIIEAEYLLQKHLIKTNQTSFLFSIIYFFLRIFILNLPSKIISKIYNYLRKRK